LLFIARVHRRSNQNPEEALSAHTFICQSTRCSQKRHQNIYGEFAHHVFRVRAIGEIVIIESAKSLRRKTPSIVDHAQINASTSARSL
jgi:hypothetical protein